MFSKATTYIDKLIEEKKLPFIKVMVRKGHEEIYTRFGSYANRHGEGEPLCMFSCTKMLTAVCGMRLLEEGKIELDAPVSNYIPAFKDAYTLDENREKHTEVIRVRHLFTMSTGLDYKIATPEIIRFSKKEYETAGTVDVISALLCSPLNFRPGERFLYGLSHDALGALIEAVEGMTLAEYMQQYIFEPLGMKNSTMENARNRDNPPTNYDILEDNSFVVQRGNSYKHFHPTKRYVSGGAGLVATAEDFAIFSSTLASGGKAENGYSLLKPETIEKMKEIQFHGLNVNNNYAYIQGNDYGYGLGVRVRTVPLECGIPVGEFGWAGAAGSYALVDTDNQISITMGMNILSWPKVFADEHLAIAKLIYEDLTKK